MAAITTQIRAVVKIESVDKGVRREFGAVKVALTSVLQTRQHEIVKRLPMDTPTSDGGRKRRGLKGEVKKKKKDEIGEKKNNF